MPEKTKPIVVVGLLGTTLDRGWKASRWERWRPSISLCQHEEVLVSRFELLVGSRFKSLAIQVAQDIAVVSPETEVCFHPFDCDDAWDFEQVYQELLTFASSYPFKPEQEQYLVHITTGTHVAQICLFLLTEARFLPGKLVQTSPPTKKESSPGHYAIIDLDLSRYDPIATRLAERRTKDYSWLKSGIQTRNALYNRLIEQIEFVALNSPAPLLLMGPTGAGKSQLAQRIYEITKEHHRLKGEFIAVNCATIRSDGAMSALFGHTRGAFTGAVSSRKGLLLAAHQGLLFLDEIGELGLEEQAMLLRAVEDGTFYPVGAEKPVRSSFRLIAATNKNLLDAIQEGTFRADLLARINLWTFTLPHLRDRAEDIEPNIDFELQRATKELGRKISFNKEGRERFLHFALSPQARWEGNFRDLSAAITRMGTLARQGRIGIEEVREEIGRLRGQWVGTTSSEVMQLDLLPRLFSPEALEEIDLFDQLALEGVLRVCARSNSLADAGRELFNASRLQRKTTNDADRLRKFLLRYDLKWSTLRDKLRVLTNGSDHAD